MTVFSIVFHSNLKPTHICFLFLIFTMFIFSKLVTNSEQKNMRDLFKHLWDVAVADILKVW